MIAVLLLAALDDGVVFRAAQVELTPTEPLPLGGYTARKDALVEPGGDPLYARALVVESGTKHIAIVSFEALTVPESLYFAVKDKLPKGVHLFLSATHTHAAPDSQMLNERMTFKVPGIASFSRRWMDWYAERIASCVTAAIAAPPLKGGDVSLAVAEVDANRGRREGAVPIKTATYLVSDGKPILTSFAAHGTIFDEKRNQTSGDWPGAVAKQLGGLVLPGAIGDVSPDFPSADAGENLKNIVEKLRSGLGLARVKRLFASSPGIAWIDEPIALEKPVPHPGFSTAFGAPPPLDQVLVGRFAPTEARVFLCRIGGLLMIGIPGEPTSEVGRQLLAAASSAGFPQAIVVSHTNGWIGYILEPADYDRGGYEATLSFHGRGTADRVKGAVERALKRLVQEPRVAHVR